MEKFVILAHDPKKRLEEEKFNIYPVLEFLWTIHAKYNISKFMQFHLLFYYNLQDTVSFPNYTI